MPRGPNVARGRCLDVSPRPALRVGGPRPREPRAPPSTPGPPALRSPTTPRAVGPGPLGLAVPGLGGLAIQSRHRAAGDGARVASPRLAALLALEVQAEPARPPEARRRASPLIRRMARENPTWGRRRIQTFSGSCQAVFFERCRSCCRAIVAKWYDSSYGTWRSHRTKMIFSHFAPNARRASRCKWPRARCSS